jgi:hypothetical protein
MPELTTLCRIDVDAFYDADSLRHSLGMRVGTLDRARKNGELHFTKCGGRVLYLGQWVVDWLMRARGPRRHEGLEPAACA